MRKTIIAAAVALPIAGVAAYALAATNAPDAGTTDTLSMSATELASADQLTVKPHKRLSIKGVFGDDEQGSENEGIENEGGEGPDSE